MGRMGEFLTGGQNLSTALPYTGKAVDKLFFQKTF